jgi:hypothetical protein
MRFIPYCSFLKVAAIGIAAMITIFPASCRLHAFQFIFHARVPAAARPLQSQFQFISNLPSTRSIPQTRRARYDDDEDANDQGQPTRTRTIQIDPTLDDIKVTQLFAWISRALAGDPRYNDLTTALAAIFGTVPDLQPLIDHAVDQLPINDNYNEHILTGVPLTLAQREESSLGAMGAAQWLGIFQTRPHSLLDVTQYKKNNNNIDINTDTSKTNSVDDWVASLPRGCRRTLQRSFQESIHVTIKNIRPNRPAPHSSLSHFRCVVEHEMRLLFGGKSSSSYYSSASDFFNAMAEAVGRFMGTTRMVGDIYEYRDSETNRILAFSHQVRKGNTIRGQWFYGTDEASRRYVWFRSVHELVRRAIETDGIDIVDLGPSGSDAFSELKAKYGFVSVDDWTNVADYTGPFWYDEDEE